MQIIEKKISELKPYDTNTKKNFIAVKKVTNHIKKFGFVFPIVIDENNCIVTGYMRYKAAKKLKIEKVPCVFVGDLTVEQINVFILADNLALI